MSTLHERMTGPLLLHAPNCPRPVSILRMSWQGQPEIFCPGCGHAAPGTDTRPRKATEPSDQTEMEN
jgi:hypothetical protein